jgi:hypothetical protein
VKSRVLYRVYHAAKRHRTVKTEKTLNLRYTP